MRQAVSGFFWLRFGSQNAAFNFRLVEGDPDGLGYAVEMLPERGREGIQPGLNLAKAEIPAR